MYCDAIEVLKEGEGAGSLSTDGRGSPADAPADASTKSTPRDPRDPFPSPRLTIYKTLVKVLQDKVRQDGGAVVTVCLARPYIVRCCVVQLP